MNSKKTISPVVATALLLVVAVVAVVSFQTWFGDFSSSTFSKVETESNNGVAFGTLTIEDLIGSTLYVKNNIADNLSLNSLKIGNINCIISENLSLGINEIDVDNCLRNVTSTTPGIVLVTDTKIIEKTEYVQNYIPLPVCLLDSVTIYQSTSAVFYNSSAGYGACYSETRTCSNGVLDGTSSFNLSSCTLYYDLTCNTDLDGDGFINSTCASYPMTNTILTGSLDTNDNNLTIKPDMSCMFNDYKNATSCINNLVLGGCDIDANGVNDTVLDISTGLCWQKNMASSGMVTWANAKIYCDGLSLGGQTDWRLPTKEELTTLIDLSRITPSIIGGNTIFQTPQSYYWSISSYGVDGGFSGWRVVLGAGYTQPQNKATSISNYAVCIR